jgi:uncharacterized membrane-anchored protein YhcB (DUF1043 family)
VDALTIILAIFCLLLGAAAGIVLYLRFSPELQKSRDLEKHLFEAQDELKNYQLEVTQHFSETAQLLKQMAESYRDVHNHLARGAEMLCKDGQGRKILARLPELDSIIDADSEPTYAAPPLDYAPKTTPYDRSTLNEDYGLDKVELTEKPIADIAQAIAENARKK